MAVSSSAAVPVVVVMVLLICALCGVAVWLFVRRRRRLAQQTARPFTVGGGDDDDADSSQPARARPSFINLVPATTVLTAAVSPAVAASFQTREVPSHIDAAPRPPAHRRGSVYSAIASLRSNPFSDGRARESTSDVSTVAGSGWRPRSASSSVAGSGIATPRAVSRQGSLARVSRPPSRATVTGPPPSSEHPFSPDFRPAPSFANPVVLRVRTSMQPQLYSPASSNAPTHAALPTSAATTPRPKEKELPVPEEQLRERDATDPPPSYTPRSGLSAFALSPSGHTRSASASTWDSRDDF